MSLELSPLCSIFPLIRSDGLSQLVQETATRDVYTPAPLCDDCNRDNPQYDTCVLCSVIERRVTHLTGVSHDDGSNAMALLLINQGGGFWHIAYSDLTLSRHNSTIRPVHKAVVGTQLMLFDISPRTFKFAVT